MIALLLAGCRPLPDHLRLDPPASAGPGTAAAPVTDRASAIRAVVGPDPLARHPASPSLAGAPGTAALAAFLQVLNEVETANAPIARSMRDAEEANPGTEVVALARGYRLRIAEATLLDASRDPRAAQRDVVELLTPLRLGTDDPTAARLPLDALGAGEHARAAGERWAATGWLAGADIPVEALLPALAAPQYDGLRERPIGRLLRARGERPLEPAAGDAAFDDLRRATLLAVTRTAADRDAEQGAWADLKRAVATEVDDPDPVGRLLERAFEGFLLDAGRDRSAGGALLAVAALRWEDRCPDAPCVGVDRLDTARTAGTWDPDLAPLAAAWLVLGEDEVLATLDAGRDTGLFPRAALDLADVLVANTGAADLILLTRSRPDAAVWLSASREVGVDGVTDWEGARVALGRHLEAGATRAAAGSTPDLAALFERIASRAVP